MAPISPNPNTRNNYIHGEEGEVFEQQQNLISAGPINNNIRRPPVPGVGGYTNNNYNDGLQQHSRHYHQTVNSSRNQPINNNSRQRDHHPHRAPSQHVRQNDISINGASNNKRLKFTPPPPQQPSHSNIPLHHQQPAPPKFTPPPHHNNQGGNNYPYQQHQIIKNQRNNFIPSTSNNFHNNNEQPTPSTHRPSHNNNTHVNNS